MCSNGTQNLTCVMLLFVQLGGSKLFQVENTLNDLWRTELAKIGAIPFVACDASNCLDCYSLFFASH